MAEAGDAIANNHPVLPDRVMIDERTEEVTDMQENVRPTVIASTFDERPTGTCRWPTW